MFIQSLMQFLQNEPNYATVLAQGRVTRLSEWEEKFSDAERGQLFKPNVLLVRLTVCQRRRKLLCTLLKWWNSEWLKLRIQVVDYFDFDAAAADDTNVIENTFFIKGSFDQIEARSLLLTTGIESSHVLCRFDLGLSFAKGQYELNQDSRDRRSCMPFSLTPSRILTHTLSLYHSLSQSLSQPRFLSSYPSISQPLSLS